MSSKIFPIYSTRPYNRGEQNGIDNYPNNIKNIIIELFKTNKEIGIFGSYKKGNWVEDSDLDIGLNDYKSQIDKIKELSELHAVKIDCIEIRDWMLIIKNNGRS